MNSALQRLAQSPPPAQLLPARELMAFTLGSHILLVPFGVALPAITLLMHYRGLRKGDPVALQLARRWSAVMAVQFAIGIVTGTVLSFEFGLLWPHMMGRWGDVFGLGFGIEAWAFFLEAILIAIYLYGWRRLKPWTHFWLAVPLPLTALMGAFGIVAANSWMNTPRGFTVGADGKPGARQRPTGRLHPDVRPRVLALRGRRDPDRGVRRGRGVRGRLAARAPGPLPPARLHRAVHGRRDPDPGAVRARRLHRPIRSSTSSPRSSRPARSSGRPTPTYRSTCSAGCTPTARSPAG